MAAGIKRLANHHPPFRLRVRNRRVLFSFDGTRQLILIEAIRKRDEHTY
jgi:mRNA-degrading endonuclease RelE of RelBE toxin-antitoxin system